MGSNPTLTSKYRYVLTCGSLAEWLKATGCNPVLKGAVVRIHHGPPVNTYPNEGLMVIRRVVAPDNLVQVQTLGPILREGCASGRAADCKSAASARWVRTPPLSPSFTDFRVTTREAVMTATHMQCKLKRFTGAEMTTWLPSKFAVEGKIVDFDQEGPGWRVMRVAAGAVDSKVIAERERDYRNHRKATDV